MKISGNSKGSITAGVIAPHPPHLVYAERAPQNEAKAECGWEELRWGYERLRELVSPDDYDVIIVHSPHWMTRVGQHFLAVPHLKGLSVDPTFPHLFRYQYDVKIDVELSQSIASEAQQLGLETHLMTNPKFRVDYGTLISCHLVNPEWNRPIIAMSANAAHFDYSNEVGQDQVLRLGQATRKAVEKSGKRALLLASCSLSHRHFTVEPEVVEDMSREFVYHHGQYLWDMKLLTLFKTGKSKDAYEMLPDYIEQSTSEAKAGSLGWLLSALDFPTFSARIHAYGSVIGTGNAVVSWHPQHRGEKVGFR